MQVHGGNSACRSSKSTALCTLFDLSTALQSLWTKNAIVSPWGHGPGRDSACIFTDGYFTRKPSELALEKMPNLL
jgi:hypothetical protein